MVQAKVAAASLCENDIAQPLRRFLNQWFSFVQLQIFLLLSTASHKQKSPRVSATPGTAVFSPLLSPADAPGAEAWPSALEEPDQRCLWGGPASPFDRVQVASVTRCDSNVSELS